MATDFETVVLGPDEFLLLKPKERLTPDFVEQLRTAIPARLRDRVIVVNPGAFQMMVVRKIGE